MVRLNKLYKVYRNLNNGKLSIKNSCGLVVGHCDAITLTSVEFKVNRKGVERIRNNRRKEVVATANGNIVSAEGFVSLTGTINEKTVDKVTINGEEVYIESNNTFLEMLDVPMSGLEVRVVASNEGTKVESIKFKIKVK